MSFSIVAIKTPTLQNTNSLYELNFDTFQLPEGVVPLDVMHRVDHKTQQSLNIPLLNTNNNSCRISKGSPIATLALAGKCEESRRSAGADFSVILQSYLPQYPKTLVCSWNLTLHPHWAQFWMLTSQRKSVWSYKIYLTGSMSTACHRTWQT